MSADENPVTLKAIMDVVKSMEEKMVSKDDFNGLKSDFNGLKSDFNGLKSDFEDFKRSQKEDIGKLSRTVGDLVERSLRQAVIQHNGHSFAKNMNFIGISDLVTFILKSSGHNKDVDLHQFLKGTKKVVSFMVEKKIHYHYLRCLVFEWSQLSEENKDTAVKFFSDKFDSFEIDSIGKFIGLICDDKFTCFPGDDDSHFFQKKLGQILRVIKNTENMEMCGNGVMSMVIFGALVGDDLVGDCFCENLERVKVKLRDNGVKEGLAFNIAEELEVDCRGSVQSSGYRGVIYVGEIKSSGKLFLNACLQLKLRLKVYKWVASVLLDTVKVWVMVGYLFYPESQKSEIKVTEIEDVAIKPVML